MMMNERAMKLSEYEVARQAQQRYDMKGVGIDACEVCGTAVRRQNYGYGRGIARGVVLYVYNTCFDDHIFCRYSIQW